MARVQYGSRWRALLLPLLSAPLAAGAALAAVGHLAAYCRHKGILQSQTFVCQWQNPAVIGSTYFRFLFSI